MRKRDISIYPALILVAVLAAIAIFSDLHRPDYAEQPSIVEQEIVGVDSSLLPTHTTPNISYAGPTEGRDIIFSETETGQLDVEIIGYTGMTEAAQEFVAVLEGCSCE